MFYSFRLFAFSVTVVAFTILGFSDAVVLHAQIQDKANSKSEVKRKWVKDGWRFDKSWTPVMNDAEAEKWGEEFAQAIAERDVKRAGGLIDFDNLLDRSVNDVDDQDFRNGFKQGSGNIENNLLAQFLTEGTSYEFRGVKQSPFGPNVLMRLLDVNGGCNYHFWRLYKNPDGKLIGADVYIVITGETLGDTIRRLVVLGAPKNEQTFFQKLVGTEKVMAKHQAKLLEMFDLIKDKDSKKILKAYAELPKSLQQEKFMLVIRMVNTANEGEQEYIKSIEEFQKVFPNDPSIDLASLDLYFLKKQYTEIYKCLDRLEKKLGPDAHLLTLRSVALLQEKKYDKATEVLKDAIKAEPGFETAYWNAIHVALAKQDFDYVNQVLKSIVKTFGYAEFDFESDSTYEPFIGTKQHKDFEAFLKTQNAVD